MVMLRVVSRLLEFFFFKQKTAYELRISDWSSDVFSSDLWKPVVAHFRPGVEREPGIKPGGERAEHDLERKHDGERDDGRRIARGPGGGIARKLEQVERRPHQPAKDEERRRKMSGKPQMRYVGPIDQPGCDQDRKSVV